jgi:membrane protease YdiL (CAAX protease family)
MDTINAMKPGSKRNTITTKNVNLLFLTIIMTHILIILMMLFVPNFLTVEGIMSIIVGQLIVAVPTIIFLLYKKIEVKELLVFGKIRVTTVLLIILYMYLMMPMTSLLNAISQTVSTNVVLELTQDMVQYPFIVTWLMVGVIGPAIEELICRGILYEGYKKHVSPVKAMIVSSLIFGMLHMNLNQMPYAFALGIVLVLLKEATGTIVAPMLFHMFFNSQSVILMYAIPADLLEESANAAEVIPNQMVITITILAIVAVISTIIGLCVLSFIAKREGRTNIFNELKIKGSENKAKIGSFPLYLGTGICFAFMIWQIIVQ